MLTFLRLIIYCTTIVSFTALSQHDVKIAIQQGHSSDIELIALSPKSEFIATSGLDNRLVIWDYKTGNQLSFKYFASGIQNMTFTSRYKLGLVYKNGSEAILDVRTMESIQSFKNDQLHFKLKSEIEFNQSHVILKGSKIILYNKNSKKKIKTRTTDYFDQPFTSILYSDIQQKIYCSAEDGRIYVYDKNLKLINQLNGHNSSANDLALSLGEKFLYSVSSDRSIIKWDLIQGSIKKRISAKNFPTYGLSINSKGNRLLFGDEIGNLRRVNMDNSKLEIESENHFLYPLTQTFQFKDSSWFFSGHDNKLIYNQDKTTIAIKNIRFGEKTIPHYIFTQKLNFYQPPYSQFKSIAVNSQENLIALSANLNSLYPNFIKLVQRSETGKLHYSKKLYVKGEFDSPELLFLNDSTLISISKNTMVVWRIVDQDLQNIRTRTIDLPYKIDHVSRVNDSILVALNGVELVEYNFYQDTWDKSVFSQLNATNRLNNTFEVSHNVFAIVDKLNKIWIYNFHKNEYQLKLILIGHQDQVTSVVYHHSSKMYYSSSLDGTVKLWQKNDSSNLLLSIVPIGKSNCIYITPDNYYMVQEKDMSAMGFNIEGKFFYPEQFDPIYNRPDIVMSRLPYTDKKLISAYYHAYQKRLNKLGFSEDMLKSDFHLPKIELKNSVHIPNVTQLSEIELDLYASDSKYKLDRINLWINDVAIYGSRGKSIRELSSQTYQSKLKVQLANGENKIQISVTNQAGAESFKESLLIESNQGELKSDLYLVTIGVSKYKESKYDLKFADKDAMDVNNLLKSSKLHANVYSKILTNENVTVDNILELESFIKQAKINDEVIIFIAGHGVLDENLDYYFASHDLDFLNPSEKGIAYEQIETLLDGISPLKKILFIDACHSGEIDKEEIELVDNDQTESGDIQFRTVGKKVDLKLGVQSTLELSKSLFLDLRKGTGATIVSSAGGLEFAIESEEWENGLFTYCLLEGLKSNNADLNNDGEIYLSELQKYIQDRVYFLSDGKQSPTSRLENQVLDYRVW